MTPLESNLKVGQRWEFDEEVTASFDDMLRRSIPQYDVMRDVVTRVASRFVQRLTPVVDLGSSRGEAIQGLIDRFGAYNTWHLVEVSPPMAESLRRRHENLINHPNKIVQVYEMDLRTDFPPVMASLVLSVLTLQFTPIDYRQRIVQAAYDHLLGGGALVVVEKVMGSTSSMDAVFRDEYHDLKMSAGYSSDEIERKRLALEGVLVPVTVKWNEEVMASAGFKEVECFWRWMNFAAWVAIK